MFLSSNGALKAKFMQNDEGKLSGNYHAFRMSALTIAVDQNLAKASANTAVPSIGIFDSGSKIKTFYQTNKEERGEWYDLSAATISTSAHILGTSSVASVAKYGPQYSAC